MERGGREAGWLAVWLACLLTNHFCVRLPGRLPRLPPQVVSLMSDVALLASSLALTRLQQQQQGCSPAAAAAVAFDACSAEAVCAAASRQVNTWLGEVRASVTSSGILSEAATSALLSQWDWQPVLQQASLQLTQQQQPAAAQQQQLRGSGRSGGSGNGCGGGPNSAELRRAMQRSVRQLADMIRRSGITPAAPACTAAHTPPVAVA